MYQAKVEIRAESETGSFTIIDASIGDELPLTREVTLRDGLGKLTTYQFDVSSNEILVSDLTRDLAYNIDYVATVSVPEFGSKYTNRIAFITTGYAEDLLLNLQWDVHCNPEKGDICDSKIISDLIQKSSEIISYLEAAKYYIDLCRVVDAQKLLDFINDYRTGILTKYDQKCGCGCS